jgi:hypothetical protein
MNIPTFESVVPMSHSTQPETANALTLNASLNSSPSKSGLGGQVNPIMGQMIESLEDEDHVDYEKKFKKFFSGAIKASKRKNRN